MQKLSKVYTIMVAFYFSRHYYVWNKTTIESLDKLFGATAFRCPEVIVLSTVRNTDKI